MNPFGDDPDWASMDDDPFDGDFDEENEGSIKDAANVGAQHILLLIDCDHSMFEQYVPCLSDPSDDSDESGDIDGADCKMQSCNYVSPMDVAVTAAHRFLRTKIRDVAETNSGKRDGVGVLLYGCDPYRSMGRGTSSANATNGIGKSVNGMKDASKEEVDDETEDDDEDLLPSTYELIELTAPGIEQILTIQKCLPSEHKSSRKRRNLQSEFSSGDRKETIENYDEDGNVCSLLQGLTAALKVFGSAKCVRNPTPASKQLPDSKSVWIFTNQDDPCHGDDAKSTRIQMVTRDFQEAGVVIHILPLPKKSSSGVGTIEFDHSIFYSNLESFKDYVHVASDSDGIVDVEAILEIFDVGTKKRRKYATLPLLLPSWEERKDSVTRIMLDLYSTVQVRNKPQKIPVHQETNRITSKRTIRIITESGEEVSPENLHHSANFCGGRVSLQPANVAMLKQASNSRGKSSLLIHGFRPMKQLSTSNLLSKAVLAMPNDARVHGSGKALHNLKQSMLKKNVFAVGELLVRASATSKMVALVPEANSIEGLYIIHIPYKEDTREVNKMDLETADRSLVDAAKSLISKSVLHFDNFASCLPENPYLKHFFGYLESVSLGKPLGPVEDDAKMDIQQMIESAGEEIESFSKSLPDDEQPLTTDRKRKAPPSLKHEFKREPICQDWIELYENDEIANLKSDELKAFLKSQGERLAGKKADLVDRVQMCIQKVLMKDL